MKDKCEGRGEGFGCGREAGKGEGRLLDPRDHHEAWCVGGGRRHLPPGAQLGTLRLVRARVRVRVRVRVRITVGLGLVLESDLGLRLGLGLGLGNI